MHRYLKLEALGNLATALQDELDTADVIRRCAVHLSLGRTAEEYDHGKEILYSFNICFESLDVSGRGNLLDLSCPLSITRTRWNDLKPSEISDQLLAVLERRGCDCEGSKEQDHQAVLRLNGFQLEANPLMFDMFFLTCKSPRPLAGKPIYTEKKRFGRQEQVRERHIFNLCDDINRHHPRDSDPTVLHISFDTINLYATPKGAPTHSDAFPMMSLESLLGGGFFQNPTSGGAFKLTDKAILALSLARCLLHLFQSRWIERPWTAGSIQFLYRDTPAEISDVHHPYVCYRLPSRELEQTEPVIDRYENTMLSFARILLEIEIGDMIIVDPTKDIGDALSDILEGIDGPRGHYHQAIVGCLQFRDLLTAMQRRERKKKLDYQIRRTLYTGVVEHLERNLCSLRNHKKLFLGTTRPQFYHRSTRGGLPAPRAEVLTASDGRYSLHPRPLKRSDFEIAIFCALRREFDAVALIFDEFWDEDDEPFGKAPRDQNTYTTGRIGRFNAVLVLLPGMGKVNAASTAANFRVSFPRVELALLVGICGGIPGYQDHSGRFKEILLGDVIISDDIVQYDFGRLLPNGFKRKDSRQDALGRPNIDIVGFIATLRTEIHLDRLQRQTAKHLAALQIKSRHGRFTDPGEMEDKLFQPSYRHKHRDGGSINCNICIKCASDEDPVCEEALGTLCTNLSCDETQLVPRQRLIFNRENVAESRFTRNGHKSQDQAPRPAIHFGSIASGDTVMKSGNHRDMVAKRDGIIAFEMEGAGVWDNLSCIVIKGVCDYSDSHKNKMWQDFAAATAASATKALLERYHKQTNEV
ncbi:hypothetical protein AOL_s00210g68 [Orbilia oligospora ATCC 24927]|uniref:Uncharacterized protein n=1 Tax=Arthrobotrys oligospora (strain ATCC 24927 / CBS 115.81 / DSM 1491) TaxID=756982 RepID=G1XRS4_ARTOA|nr:hypothetical protein AOL_s00210g68 [Orbilia oligospora ATCC 24927]EGX44196.1 hypothetical protein AOL_s00210g68 [Orbilia oligospora ATCC 24927]